MFQFSRKWQAKEKTGDQVGNLHASYQHSTPLVKKTRHQTRGHNLTNCYPIFKIFSLADSVVNLQQTHV